MAGKKGARGSSGNSFTSLLIATAISLAGFLYGLDTGIMASTIAQQSFKLYMFGPSMENVALNGAMVSGYYVGSAIGSAMASWSMDKLSRRWSLLLGSSVSVVGAIMQAAAMNPAMMIVGRVLSGYSTGMVYPTAPVYLSELSPPENRSFLVGLKGLLNTLGFATASWVGYAGSFATGDIQWRIPLATQGPPALLLACLTFVLPYSPRWLLDKERHDDAKKVMIYLHAQRGDEFIEREYNEMMAQIRFENELKRHSKYATLFTKKYARRMLLACLIVNMTKLSGSNVIQTYQSLMYDALGYEGQSVLLLTAVYGCMALIAQFISIFTISDRWSRRFTVLTGEACLAAVLIIAAVLSALFPDGENVAGARAGVAFIYLFNFTYSFFFNSVVWVLVAEIFPLELRGVGVGFAVFTQAITAIWLNYAANYAFVAITWKFYFVFVACNIFAGVMYYFFLPETNQLTLEEIGAKFGDPVSDTVAKALGGKDEDGNDVIPEKSAGEHAFHVESKEKSDV